MNLVMGGHIPPLRPSVVYSLQHPDKYEAEPCGKDHCRRVGEG